MTPSDPMPADALVRLHADLVYRVALRVTGNADDAADATQDALVKLWQHGAEVPAERQRGWAARVARNSALDLLRRRAVRPRTTDDEIDLACSSATPDAASETSELRAGLEAALGTLGEPFRSLVVLRDVEGLAYDEIAEALSLPLTTVKVYLHRARARLRTALQTSVPDLVPCP